MSIVRTEGYSREQALAAVHVGWHALVNQLFDLKEGPCNALNLIIIQVKQKFGALRVYHVHAAAPDNPQLQSQWEQALVAAEAASLMTCEHCGAPGSLQVVQHYYTTLCDKHHAQRLGSDEGYLPVL